jgi:hypothetical protein
LMAQMERSAGGSSFSPVANRGPLGPFAWGK